MYRGTQLSNTAVSILSRKHIHSAVINNMLIKSSTSFQSIDPANGNIVGNVVNCSEYETKEAINSARDCFKEFKYSLASQRAKLLTDWGDLINADSADIAQLVTLEMGKPLAEARGEVAYATSLLDHFAGRIKSGLIGEVLTPGFSHWRPINIRQPVGPVATITPWNFPVSMVTRKAGAAIAAGCSVINAPSEDTPLVSLYLAKLGIKAGFPEGLFNVIPSSRENKSKIGKILCESTDIAALSFTGSTAVGKILSKQCADSVKRVHLELGGNAPLIVFESADIQKAVACTMSAKFRNAGQACIAVNRVFVHKNLYNEFLEKLSYRIMKLKVGNGLTKGTDIGPLVNLKGFQKVSSIVSDTKLVDGVDVTVSDESDFDVNAPFYKPTLISCYDKTNVPIFDQEIFGPVAAIYSFSSESEVVEMANKTRYGLQAFIFTSNISQSWRVSEKLEYGMVAVNEGVINFANNPFGGWKESGIGREAGHLGIDEFTENKLICFGLN